MLQLLFDILHADRVFDEIVIVGHQGAYRLQKDFCGALTTQVFQHPPNLVLPLHSPNLHKLVVGALEDIDILSKPVVFGLWNIDYLLGGLVLLFRQIWFGVKIIQRLSRILL